MINVRMQIGDGSIEDVFTAHKLIYKGSDHRFEAPIKKRDTSSYIEEAGEHTDPRTVQDAFDYKVQFVIDAQNKNLKNVNAIIANFNSKLYIQERGSDIRTYNNVTFYNDFKRVKIVGIPEPIQEAKTLYRTKNGYDCAVVEFLIRVSNPKICDFNLSEQTNLFVIACAGSAARAKGHYLYATSDGTLIHTNTLNDYSMWGNREDYADGGLSLYNMGEGGWFNGTATLSKDANAKAYVYSSPEVANAVGFNKSPNVDVGQYSFLNAKNSDSGMGEWRLDEDSSFVLVPYAIGDTDETLQTRLDEILIWGDETPKPIRLSITTDGARVFISTSRPLRDGEHICMLTRASKRGIRRGADGTAEAYRSKYRWHVNHTRPLTLGNTNELRMTVGGNVPEEREIVTLLDGLMRRVVYSKTKDVAFVPKGFNSQKPLSDIHRFRSIVYGVGVYDTNGIENHKFQRISNICYFYGNWKYASGNVELNLSLEYKESAL